MPFYQSHRLLVCVCGLGVLKEQLEIVLGTDGSVGIATCYGQEGPGIESLWGGEIFRTLPDWPWCPTSFLYKAYGVSFTGEKRPCSGVDHPPHLAPSFKEK